MVNLDIYGGLVSALSRGSSWYDAMMSLYNAGYSKNEIEEAAGFLKAQISGKAVKNPEPSKVVPPQIKPAFTKKPSVDFKPVSQTPSNLPQKAPQSKVRQLVSSYSPESDAPIYSGTPLEAPQEPPSYEASKPTPPMKELPKQSQKLPVNPFPNASRVSDYTGKPLQKKSKSLIIFLVLSLIILFGALVALFLFKDKIFEFLESAGF